VNAAPQRNQHLQSSAGRLRFRLNRILLQLPADQSVFRPQQFLRIRIHPVRQKPRLYSVVKQYIADKGLFGNIIHAQQTRARQSHQTLISGSEHVMVQNPPHRRVAFAESPAGKLKIPPAASLTALKPDFIHHKSRDPQSVFPPRRTQGYAKLRRPSPCL